MVKDVKLKKGMCRDEVNRLLKENDVDLELVDEIYGGNRYGHKWRCECGNIIEKRTWGTITRGESLICDKCKYQIIENRYKYEVEKTGEYEYIRSFRKGEILPKDKIAKAPYIQIRHKFCENTYEVLANSFINMKQRCPKCCGSYENSFAYYIEKELCEPLEKYWDFEKNTVNPYTISKNRNAKSDKDEDLRVWIKCIKKDYHESYMIACSHFIKGCRCPYCNTFASGKVHPKDSFASKYPHFLKYWSNSNKHNADEIAPKSNKEYKFICSKCGKIFLKKPVKLINQGCVCSKCAKSKGEQKIEKWLIKNNIEYEDQKKFKYLVGIKGKNLSYDFYIPFKKILIEYQGNYHEGKAFGQLDEEQYRKQQEHDRRKREYATINGYELLEIWYWDFDNIEEILDKEMGSLL